MNDLVYFFDWNIVTLNGRSIFITFWFDWMSFLFMGFVFIISPLVILYNDDYMFGDLNIFRFISLVCPMLPCNRNVPRHRPLVLLLRTASR